MQNKAGMIDGNLETGPRLEITTLGRFEVRCGEVVISEEAKRSYRLWDLFRYLITFRERNNPPEIIAETLWPEQDYDDPKGAVRTMIYRLRQLLTKKTGCAGKTDFIVFHQGGYQWNVNSAYRLDVDDFERLCKEAEQAAAQEPDRAVDLYLETVSLYKGEYLPQCLYHEWAIPVRHRYHRIYLKALAELIILLKQARHYSRIIKVCEGAFTVEPLEEELHLAFLDALIMSGNLRQACSHYEYVTSAMYRELGVKPSPAMRAVYRRMHSREPGLELDLDVIQESLAGHRTADGAFLCDPETFQALYELEQRRGERTGRAVFLVLLTVSRPDYEPPHPEMLRRAMGELADHLVGSLRKGDVISQWNKAQFLLIMPGLNMEEAERVLARITADFGEPVPGLVLRTKLQSLLPLKEPTNA